MEVLGGVSIIFRSTNYGDIEFGFFPRVAPRTVEHIFRLVRLGCYNTNHFFRVINLSITSPPTLLLLFDHTESGSAPMNDKQKIEAEKTVIDEFSSVKHVRGILSMGRYSNPNSGGSSFSILLGDAPHLDGQYAVFGRMTKGDETLKSLKNFQLPVERITILSTYYYDTTNESCDEERFMLKRKLAEAAVEIERQRQKCFP
ncbi:unnamed protein product [Spirodela intermedia]|uniref:PPIase cyclophilin-type domain-containing protein n=1 Tax=Spirodela intermedia TaxID=51605 RepID=A0A7I8J2Z9_SPIIN|nr:unnamed protein product [Spirodela intermedia]CAA6664498.1 unnamed protein product [Spirodela intermedia]